MFRVLPGLWDRSVVPGVTLHWPNVGNISEFALKKVQQKYLKWYNDQSSNMLIFNHLFDVLLNRVQFFFSSDFHFGVGPTGHFHDHVVNVVLAGNIARNIVKGAEIIISIV